MYISHTIEHFNQQVVIESNKIENIELKIILALSDLLNIPKEYDSNFINNSLLYLKEHYYLSNSVWKVLLKLNEKVPDFIHTLSNWNDVDAISYVGKNLLRFNDMYYKIGFNENRFYNSNREYNISKLFKLIHLMCQHFSIEDSTAYVGLFIKEFDTKQSVFSICNLSIQSEYLKSIKSPDRINNISINFFRYMFTNLDTIYFDLKILHILGEEIINLKMKKIPTIFNNHFRWLSSIFKKIGIPYTNPLENFNDLMCVYNKYTKEESINYKGLLEIRNQSIEAKDHEVLTLLFKELDKSADYNILTSNITICFLKLIHSYQNNVLQGLQKLHDLHDYTRNLENNPSMQALYHEQKFNLKNLLELSHKWEKKDVYRSEKVVYRNYNIDCNIGNYQFEQIKDSHELHEEGQTQSHCVYTYNNACINQETIIISMKDQKFNKISTIQLTKESKKFKLFTRKSKNIWYLVENRKRFNKDCNTEEKVAANEYFEIIKHKLI